MQATTSSKPTHTELPGQLLASQSRIVQYPPGDAVSQICPGAHSDDETHESPTAGAHATDAVAIRVNRRAVRMPADGDQEGDFVDGCFADRASQVNAGHRPAT